MRLARRLFCAAEKASSVTEPFKTSMDVTWGDCDAAGIVFYPHFFRFMDTAFQRLLKSKGTGQRDLQSTYGLLGTPLLEASAIFKSPARYDDVMEMSVEIEDFAARILRMRYVAAIDGRTVFEGREVRAFVAQIDGKLRSVDPPPAFKALFAA